jgi:enterochelin esterase family protein
VSPEVHSDRRVTFRLRAPGAKEVTVSGEWGGGSQALTRDDQGVWSVTLGPLEPDLYGYSFSVDGFRSLDPANPAVKPMRSPTTSILELPGSPPRLHEFTAVPHGTVRMHWYQSKSLGRRRGLFVYTPPGYERNTRNRYPVLYLFHGAGDNEATWTALGRAHLIVDNLLAQGRAKPLLIVMPDGHAAPASPPGGPREGRSRNIQAFEQDLLQDVIPFIQENYRVRPDRESRAIVGLSMGGGQSLTIGLNHPELFGWVGGFSAAIFDPENSVATALSDPTRTNQRLRLLWIACGKDDRLIEGSQQLSDLLKRKQIHHEFHATEGNHSWPVWRRYLAQFVPLLFDDSSRSVRR